MCNSPIYRLRVDELAFERMPTRFRKRVKNGGILMDENEYEYLINTWQFKQEDFDTLPCGHCFGCKNDYQAQWVTRAICESTLHDTNYFITLTYNDENLPVKPVINDLTGETVYLGELVKKDFSSFIKRLRASISECRFLACGERGDIGRRPHFHFLAFGLCIDDLQFYYCKSRSGKISYSFRSDWTPYFLSRKIAKTWGKGFVLITPLTFENVSYVASYVNKQVTSKEIKFANGSEEILSAFVGQFGNNVSTVDNAVKLGLIQSPFLHMSRRPGLACGFIEENWYKYFQNNGVGVVGGKRTPKQSIRYFDNYFEKNDLDVYLAFIKRNRKKKNFIPFFRWCDNGKSDRLKREEVLKRRHERKKPRDL